MLRGHSLAYEHADGHVQFSSLHFNISKGHNALVGANGIGKSILARVLASDLEPTSGSIKRLGQILYFAQMAEAIPQTVAEYLAAMWESPPERQALITGLLGQIPMQQTLTTLSGGEWMRVRLSKALTQNWDFLILDEPTNNLDHEAREVIYDVLKIADFSYLVISHDRELLRQVDRIYELSNKGLQLYGGNYDFYQEQKQTETARGQQQLQSAQLNNKRRQTERYEKLQAQEKRTRLAEKKAPSMGIPKLLLGARKRNAQKTASRLQIQEDHLVEDSFQHLHEVIELQKKEKLLYFELPLTQFPNGKLLLQLKDFNFRFSENEHWLWKDALNLTLTGPARLALKGPNGSGKSSLLKILLGINTGDSKKGIFEFTNSPCVYLDQNYKNLNLDRSVFENVYASSRYDQIETRNLLARFLFQNEQVHQKINTLSGGERMRATLAKALLGQHPPQVLILDEPTNNLDLGSVQFLERLLQSFEGALIVVCHDQDFLNNIGCDQQLVLS